MDEAARIRSGLTRSLEDVTPASLVNCMQARLEASTVLPARLTLASARYHTSESVPTIDPYAQARAVQQMYLGLDITRELIAGEPWATATTDVVSADLEVLGADVFVGRAMAALADTAVAADAVAVVREFGQHQSTAHERASTPYRDLETSIAELAVSAGAATVSAEPDQGLLDAVIRLTDTTSDGFPTIEAVGEATALEVYHHRHHAFEGVASSIGDTD